VKEDTTTMGIKMIVARRKQLYKRKKHIATKSAISNAQNNKSQKTSKIEGQEHGYMRINKLTNAISHTLGMP
jgi:hypothetical protein